MLEELLAKTKAARDDKATKDRLAREEKLRKEAEEAELQYQRGKRDAVKWLEKVKDKLPQVAAEGKDNCRFKGGAGKDSPYGRGWLEVAEPSLAQLGIHFGFFRAWHTCYDYDTGKEDGGYAEFGVGFWWGNVHPDMKNHFYEGSYVELC